MSIGLLIFNLKATSTSVWTKELFYGHIKILES